MESDTEQFETLTKNEFKKFAVFYDSSFHRFFYFGRIYEKVIETVKKELEIYPKLKARFLDVACGTGEIVFRLAKEFPQVEFVGADFSEDMLEKAAEKTKNLSNVKIIHANVRELPFEEASFDIILCSDSLHHFASPEESLQEINRVTKQGNVFFLVDPAFDTLFQKIIIGFFGKIIETPKKYYSKREVTKLLRDNTQFVTNSNFTYYLTNFFVCRKMK